MTRKSKFGATCFSTGLALAAMLWAQLTTAARAADLEVMEFKCSAGVENAEPVGTINCESAQLPSPLFIWARLRGDESALNSLASKQQLTIRYKWLRYVGPRPEIQTLNAEDIGAGVIEPGVLEKLRQEVRARGFFDWRTWTVKRNLRASSYIVDIVDQAYRSLPCADQQSCPINVKVE